MGVILLLLLLFLVLVFVVFDDNVFGRIIRVLVESEVGWFEKGLR